MPPKSPPLAFLPTPAAINPTTSDAVESSSISPPHRVSPSSSRRISDRQLSNGTSPTKPSTVTLRHFSEPAHTRQPPSFSTKPRASTSASTFIDQSRDLLENQRKVFEQERALFAQERSLWESERDVLRARIRELETALTRTSQPRKVSQSSSSGKGSGIGVFDGGVEEPIWNQQYVPDTRRNTKDSVTGSDRFWEGAGSTSRSGSIATRTFSDGSDSGRLPSISENENPSHPFDSTSPNSLQADGLRDKTDESAERAIGEAKGKEPSMAEIIGPSIDGSVIDKDLDGITLRTSALSPELLAQAKSPSSGALSPNTMKPLTLSPPTHPGLSPHHPTLTKDAGHTPLPDKNSLSANASDFATPTQTAHLHRPSVAYAPEEDPHKDEDESEVEEHVLSEPLILSGHDQKDSDFLEQLDSKLLQEARNLVYAPSPTSTASDDTESGGRVDGGEEEGVRLRFKRSMNFGSALGERAFRNA